MQVEFRDAVNSAKALVLHYEGIALKVLELLMEHEKPSYLVSIPDRLLRKSFVLERSLMLDEHEFPRLSSNWPLLRMMQEILAALLPGAGEGDFFWLNAPRVTMTWRARTVTIKVMLGYVPKERMV